MNAKRFTLALLVCTLALSGAAAAASFSSYTQAVGVTGRGHTTTGATTALGVDIAHQQGGRTPVVYAGDAKAVSRPGAAALRRSATTYGNANLTLVGQQTGLAASYYSGVKNSQGHYTYSVRSVEGRNLTELSASAITKHYSAAPRVVVANPRYVSDYAGGIANATQAGVPIIYASTPSDYQLVNATLQRLGTTTVYTTSHVPTTVHQNLTADYTTVSNLSTSTGASYVNSQAPSSASTVYIVGNEANVPYVEAASANNATFVTPASGGVGSTINSYLQNNHPRVYVVANPGSVSSSAVSAMKQNTTRSVTRIGYASRQGLSTRLMLRQFNNSNPLVATGQTSVTTQNGTASVSAPIRNYGFSRAKNIVVRLNKSQNASYSFSSQPTSQNASMATWKLSALAANGTATLSYQISGATGSVQTTPTVVSYQNGVGTSFHGAAFFGLGSWVKPIRSHVLGLVSTIQGAVQTAVSGSASNPVLIGGVLVVIIAIAAGIWYLNETRGGNHA